MAANEKQLAKRKLQWKKATKKYVKKSAALWPRKRIIKLTYFS